MYWNYLITGIRNFKRKPVYTIINLLGLSLGLTCFAFIILYLKNELGYDSFHSGAENIYRVVWYNENPQTRTPHPLAQAMVDDFGEVESAVSLSPLWGPGLTRQTFSIKNPEKNIQYDESGVLAVDSTFFKVFSFELIKGNPDNALKQVGGILISESIAKKYFAEDDPIGKFLSVNDDNSLIEVIAVFKDVPDASHFHFDFLVSYVHEKSNESTGSKYYTWDDFGHYNYIKLRPDADAKALEAKLISWLPKYVEVPAEVYRAIAQNNFGLRLQPLMDIHLHSNLLWELEPNGNIEYVYSMAAAGLLILIIACINFINLTTAQSMHRTKEIGVRKSLGALRHQLIVQFAGQTMMVALLAMVIAFFMFEIFSSKFYLILGMKAQPVLHEVFFTLLVTTVLIGLVAGLYPAIYLSSLVPTTTLKGKYFKSPIGIGMKKYLIVIQFSMAMLLVTASIVIYSQMTFIQNKALGFNKDELIAIPINNRELFNVSGEAIKTEILAIPGVISAGAMTNIPGKGFNQNPIYNDQVPDHIIHASELMVDHDFINVLEVKLLNGRSFIRENPSDISDGILLNEAAVNSLNLQDPLGKTIVWDRDGQLIRVKVLGVISDFHYQSLHTTIKPLLVKAQTRGFNYLLIKLEGDRAKETVSAIETTWRKWDERFDFEYYFLSDNLDRQYQKEQRTANILATFSFIAIVVACLGLLGIATLNFETRIKEVSIRKVLGANSLSIVILLIRDLTLLILIAIGISIPIAYWILDSWLSNFIMRISLNPFIFIIAGLGLILLAWLSIGFQIIRMTRLNSTTTLKME